jgi:hypothetical protein
MEQATNNQPATASEDMIVIDVGKYRPKQIKRFRRGESGRLLDEVTSAIHDLRAAGTLSATAETVVVVVREKRRTPKLPGIFA